MTIPTAPIISVIPSYWKFAIDFEPLKQPAPKDTHGDFHGIPKLDCTETSAAVGSDPTAPQKRSEVMLQRGNPWSPNQKEPCSWNATNLGIKHWAPSKKRTSSDCLRKWVKSSHVWLTSPELVPHSLCPSCWTSRQRKPYLGRTWRERSHAEDLLLARSIGSHASLNHGCNMVSSSKYIQA